MKTSLELSANDSLILKGIAILGMLCWHLFYCPNYYGITFSPFWHFVGIVGDSCVSIFLFVSGYGLTASYSKLPEGNSVPFTLKRLIKFYFNYWTIFLIYVPIGVFIFKNPLSQSLSLVGIVKDCILQLSGLADGRSYNATWWFNSLIIPLYFLFPLIFEIIKRYPLYSIILSFFLSSFQIGIGANMTIYMPIFLIGCIWALNYHLFSRFLSRWDNNCILFFLISLSVTVLLWLYRLGDDGIFYKGINCYLIITILLVIYTAIFIKQNRIMSKSLIFLGKHSANIYLIHTFYNVYWFCHTIYSIPNPILMLLILLGMSLVSSIIIEYLKNFLLFDRFQKKVIDISIVCVASISRLCNTRIKDQLYVSQK